MQDEGDYIVKKTAEDLEKEKKHERRFKLWRLGCVLWLAAGIGMIFGGAFAHLNWLIFTGLGLTFGGAFLLSVILLGVWAIRNGIKSYKKYGGSKTAYIMKAVVCIALILVAVAFGVCGFIFNEYLFFGTFGAFFVFILVFFGWQP